MRTRFSENTVAAQPVTVTAARVVRPERREAFEQWATEVQALAATFPGHLGSSTLRPGPGSDEYHLVCRFADADALAGWLADWCIRANGWDGPMGGSKE